MARTTLTTRRANLTARLNNLGDDETRCDLSDLAVNCLREAARAGQIRKGHGTATVADLGRIVAEETARMRDLGITLDGEGLIPYLRCRRAGSPFRLSRNLRQLVFVAAATRAAR